MRRALLIPIIGPALIAAACTSNQPTTGPTGRTAAPPASSTSPPGQTGTPSPSQVPSPLPQGADVVQLDPADFVPTIDHPYWPMSPGNRWIFREWTFDGSVQRVEVTVLAETRDVLGIHATVVHDVVTEEGELVEDTYDWYGQDTAGNLWYLGEDTKEYEGGKVVSTAGSWEAGVDGGQAGIILPADLEVGLVYRQEYYEGEAEDAAEVLSLTEWVEVPFGSFDHVLMTRDYTPLDPAMLEHKFYAQGVGPVLVIAISGGNDREELLTFRQG